MLEATWVNLRFYMKSGDGEIILWYGMVWCICRATTTGGDFFVECSRVLPLSKLLHGVYTTMPNGLPSQIHCCITKRLRRTVHSSGEDQSSAYASHPHVSGQAIHSHNPSWRSSVRVARPPFSERCAIVQCNGWCCFVLFLNDECIPYRTEWISILSSEGREPHWKKNVVGRTFAIF